MSPVIGKRHDCLDRLQPSAVLRTAHSLCYCSAHQAETRNIHRYESRDRKAA
jgi:hypothetical protein